jgi:hypothetical protein
MKRVLKMALTGTGGRMMIRRKMLMNENHREAVPSGTVALSGWFSATTAAPIATLKRWYIASWARPAGDTFSKNSR